MTRPDDPGDGRTVIASDATDTPDTARPVRRAYGTLAPGDLLNGIYRVERFIARGGMGDVYEGVNVETDERVAIKAMRAHLAADAKVLALFRKEARVLTQFAHPAIVQYRVLAREPTLELYYIVMDFIDGEPLSSMLDGVRPGMGRVIDLGRRLASGLATAHEHGAIHRDMSPDNVLLPEGRVERARIIDFGIAKSLDVSVETVVGDGFAGKIGYVAPEQFGDFDRQVGPWTDVYSLGLVLLSYARGRSSDMGSTLAEAVERRRSGPKLDDLSPLLEPLLRRMLAANPRDRIQSMQEVIAELESIDLVDPEADPVIDEPQAPPHEEDPANAVEPSRPPAPLTTFVPVEEEAQPIPAEAAGTVPPAISAVSPDAASETVEATRPKRRWIALSGLGAVAVLGGLALLLRPGASPQPAPAPPSQPAKPAPTPAHPNPAVVAAAVPPPAAPVLQPAAPDATASVPPAPALTQFPCAWISAPGAQQWTGAAGDPDAVRTAAKLGPTEAAGLLRLTRAQCATVDAMRTFDTAHGPAAVRLALSAPRVEMTANPPGCAPGVQAQAELTLDASDPTKSLALLALSPSGGLRQLFSGRDEFARLSRAHPLLFTDLGGGKLKVRACQAAAGVTGFVLVEGKGPLDLHLHTGAELRPSAGFIDWFNSAAATQGWITRAVWLQVPNARPQLTAAAQLNVNAAAGALAPKVDARSAAPAGQGRIAVAACRRYTGQAWEEMGYSSLASCVDLAFRQKCNIANAQFGDTPLRRFEGMIQAQTGGGAWLNIARSVCLSSGTVPPAPAERDHNLLRRLWPFSGRASTGAAQQQQANATMEAPGR